MLNNWSLPDKPQGYEQTRRDVLSFVKAEIKRTGTIEKQVLDRLQGKPLPHFTPESLTYLTRFFDNIDKRQND